MSYKKFKGNKSEVSLEDIIENYVASISMVLQDLGLDYNQNHSLVSGYVFEGKSNGCPCQKIVIKP